MKLTEKQRELPGNTVIQMDNNRRTILTMLRLAYFTTVDDDLSTPPCIGNICPTTE